MNRWYSVVIPADVLGPVINFLAERGAPELVVREVGTPFPELKILSTAVDTQRSTRSSPESKTIATGKAFIGLQKKGTEFTTGEMAMFFKKQKLSKASVYPALKFLQQNDLASQIQVGHYRAM